MARGESSGSYPRNRSAAEIASRRLPRRGECGEANLSGESRAEVSRGHGSEESRRKAAGAKGRRNDCKATRELVKVSSEEGTLQGGPLSPLLANIYLDKLDKEIERRGLKHVRYADDCNIYVSSQRAAQRVLEVNAEKSGTGRVWERKFDSAALRPSGRSFTPSCASVFGNAGTAPAGAKPPSSAWESRHHEEKWRTAVAEPGAWGDTP